MSRWTSPKLSPSNKESSSLSSSTSASSSQLKSCMNVEDDSNCVTCSSDCNYLNCNDLGPKGGEGLPSIFLTYASSYKRTCGQQKKQGKSRSQSPRIATEVETNEELCDESKHLLCSYVFKDIIGCDIIYRGPFGRNIVTYLDYVASGKPLKCIEQYIRQYVMPTYSNTHTEVNFVAEQTSRFREEAREIIRECVNGSLDDAVIFTGSGATSAINKLIHAMNIKPLIKDLKLDLIVFVGPYEHHSNILPWREIATKVITIRQTDNGQIDLDNLTLQLEQFTKRASKARNVLIGSFSAASNVTGILSDVNSLASIMHNYGGYAFFDYACAAPYVDIDMNPPELKAYKDAVFISPHKFIGGPQTPGVLVAKRWVFRNPVPHGPGGGTVVFVRRTAHSYTSNIEHREEGGTPAIVESIRAGLVFKLKAAFTPQFIMSREHEMFKAAKAVWSRLPDLLIMGNMNVDRLPIFPLLFYNQDTGRFVHHEFVAKILSDVFGIQVRSGCVCAGPYGMELLGMKEKVGEIYEKLITLKPEPDEIGQAAGGVKARNLIFKPGFVRLNFPFFLPEDCLHFVLKAIRMTSEKGWVLLPLYDYDRDTARFWYRLETKLCPKRSLKDVTFRTGQFGIRKSAQTHFTEFHQTTINNAATKDTSCFQSVLNRVSEASSYEEILERAELIFAEAATPDQFDIPDTTMDFTVEEDALRWFMLPSEAADIINNRQVRHLEPEDLPFLPEALRDKICSSWK